VAQETLEVLTEMGVSTAGLRSKGLEEFDLGEFHLLVNLSDHSLGGRTSPVSPDRLIHRPVLDPFGGSLTVYRRSRDAIMEVVIRELCREERGKDQALPRCPDG
jgi:protein-tyrosine-phosphatase